MPNAPGGYSLTIFTQEALRFLRMRLGFAGRINRGYDPSPQQRGSTITIPVPATFAAQDAPSSAQDINAGLAQVDLNYWKDVVFGITDQEGQNTEARIIEDHIRPAAYALASYINTEVAKLYLKVPWAVDTTADAWADLISVRKRLADNGAPMTEGDLFVGVDHTLEATLLGLEAWKRADHAGDRAGLLEGTLGRRLGMDIFATSGIQTHTSGTVISAGTDEAGALNGNHTAGATTVSINGLDGSETLKAGDTFVIAGHTQRYCVTADRTLSSGAHASVPIYPALAQAYSTGAVVTFDDGTATGNNAESFAANLAFHRDFAALATAPLASQEGSAQAAAQGIQVETIIDEETRIALRGMMWYDPAAKKQLVSLDILFGLAVLNPNLATRLRRA